MTHIVELGTTARITYHLFHIKYISMNLTIMKYNVSFDVCKLLHKFIIDLQNLYNDLFFSFKRMNALNRNKLWENI